MILLQVPDIINGFSRTEYLSVFLGFLYAAVASEFLINWAKFLRMRMHVLKNAEQISWSLLLFCFLLINWYSVWPRMQFVANSFKDFVFTLVPIMLYYFLVVLVFTEEGEVAEQKKNFEKNSRLILLLLCGYTFLQLGYDIVMLGESPFSGVNLIRFAVVISGFFAFIKNTPVRRWIVFGIGFISMVRIWIAIK